LFLPLSALGGVFFFHPRAKRRKKRTHRQTEQNESDDGGRPEWWARQVPNTRDRLARGRRLPERTEKARSLGRPPEWLEVGPGRAQRLLAFVLGLDVIQKAQQSLRETITRSA